MTEQDKQMLLRDLCCRLPYGIKVEANSYYTEIIGIEGTKISTRRRFTYPIHVIKPYLRPLSSMTEEEKGQTRDFWIDADTRIFATRLIDFYNKNHFDYRGLIPKGLAIAAVGENNPYKEKGGEE